jgi:hypothetical protein
MKLALTVFIIGIAPLLKDVRNLASSCEDVKSELLYILKEG